MTIASNAKLVGRTIVGLVIVGAALYAGHAALTVRPLDDRLAEVAAGLLLLGGLVLDFDGVFPAIKNLLSLVPSFFTPKPQ